MKLSHSIRRFSQVDFITHQIQKTTISKFASDTNKVALD